MNKQKFGTLGVYTVLYLAFLYIPVLFIPLFSFNDSIYIAFPIKSLTLEHYITMFNREPLINALYNSLQVGVVVSIISTIFGILAAKTFTKYRLPGTKSLTAFISIPLVIPLLILGIGLLTVLKSVDIKLSLFTVGAAHTVICVPFAMFVLISRLEGFDKSMEEAAQDLGESPWMTFWRVTFPLAMPGIIASLLLCFTISFDEFILAFFLGSDQPTLPLYMWSQLRFPAKLPSVLALGSLIFMSSFVLVCFAEWVRRRGVQTQTGSAI
jgi:spermidine/putrescine transport system permease protein